MSAIRKRQPSYQYTPESFALQQVRMAVRVALRDQWYTMNQTGNEYQINHEGQALDRNPYYRERNLVKDRMNQVQRWEPPRVAATGPGQRGKGRPVLHPAIERAMLLDQMIKQYPELKRMLAKSGLEDRLAYGAARAQEQMRVDREGRTARNRFARAANMSSLYSKSMRPRPVVAQRNTPQPALQRHAPGSGMAR
ncbi:hypothetical protein [Actinoplanes sp. NPDC051851]|uniref:hypothetical protein n=1 Tax=Actinoplanes sp. NPDC051851 TaxID=3154753 RepID=UPI00341BA443